MKKLLLIFVHIFTISHFFNAQYTFKKAYFSTTNLSIERSFNSDLISNQLLQTSDNGYLMTCYIDGGFGSRKALLIKTNPNGEINWVKGFNHISQPNAIYDLKENNEGGYVFASSLGYGGGLIKLDANADTIWTRHFDALAKMNSFDNTDDNGYIATGNSVYFGLNNDQVVLRFDANGDTLWTKSFEMPVINSESKIKQSSDGGFFLVGSSKVNYSTSNVFILKLDSLGNHQWSKTYDNGNNTFYMSDFTLINNDEIVVVGSSNNNLSVLKLNSLGNVVWHKEFQTSSNPDNCLTINKSNNGDFLIGGFFDNGFQSRKMVYFRLDDSGNLLWSKQTGFTGENFISDIIQTIDGGIAFTGFYSDFTGFNNLPLFKTDEFGNICNTVMNDVSFITISSNISETTITPLSNHVPFPYLQGQYFSDNYPFIQTNNIGEIIPDICLVTVDTTSQHNLVVWEKPITQTIDSFLVYREVGANYLQVGSVPYDSLSQYLDTDIGIDPNITSYRYKIAQVDTCGNISALSDFHETIHLTANQGVNDEVNLIWDTYEGFSFGTYNILRDSTSSGDWEFLGSVNFNNISFTDFNPPSTGASYMIEVVPPSTCTSTKAVDHNSTRSNRGVVGNGGPQSVNIRNKRSFKVYPNPTLDLITVELQQIELPSVITLKDIQGRVMYNTIANSKKLQLDLSGYESGIYIIGITNDNFTRELKVIRD